LGKGLFWAKVYSGQRFIQGKGLFRAKVYSGQRFIQGKGLFRAKGKDVTRQRPAIKKPDEKTPMTKTPPGECRTGFSFV